MSTAPTPPHKNDRQSLPTHATDETGETVKDCQAWDHRRLGQQMGLFSFSDESAGHVFWLPRGWRLFRRLENFIRVEMECAGYQEISTPQLLERRLWEASGHWEKYRDTMFATQDDERVLALKPMNCPGAIQVFRHDIRSYRDLPMRLSELNRLHRNEASGALHGLLRLRSFTQDDAHIFCTEAQLDQEATAFCAFVQNLYRQFGFDAPVVKFADRPSKRAGSDDVWNRAEAALRRAAESAGLDTEYHPGEGAFYGPKLEFVLKDALGRQWQCGTLQVDLILPERLGAHYVDAHGERQVPVLLHRAALGSLERFLGILLEHTGGVLPQWLHPVPIVVATVTREGNDWATQVHARLQQEGIPAQLDLHNASIGYKLREHFAARTPEVWVIGAREANSRQVGIRRLGSTGNECHTLPSALAKARKNRRPPIKVPPMIPFDHG